MQQELKKNTQKTLSAEERAQQMDEMLSEEEARVRQSEKELSIFRERQFKHAQELFELKRQEATMQAEIQGGRASVRNLRSKIHKMDEEALKQQEILYTQDFQLQQLQHKLNRMEGERTDDEKLALNNRITVSQLGKSTLYMYIAKPVYFTSDDIAVCWPLPSNQRASSWLLDWRGVGDHRVD